MQVVYIGLAILLASGLVLFGIGPGTGGGGLLGGLSGSGSSNNQSGAVGKAADLALFKLDELRFSGHGDPLAALVLCGAHRADRVMVGGKWAVLDGAIPSLDVPDLIRRHSAAAHAMQVG